MQRRTTTRRARAAIAAAALAIGLTAIAVSPAVAAPTHRQPAPHPTPVQNTADFRGVNWADPRDNYASDAVVPSGLSTSDSYRQVYAISTRMVNGFRHNLGANTLRLPINPASVGTSWWRSYRGAIDAATASGFKVILSYWESNTAKDGKVDDTAAWTSMWKTVTREYAGNPRVYFEPMNEPFGYTLDQWVGVTTSWLAQNHCVPRGRVVISGTGYNDDVTGVGATKALNGTLLSLHFYGYWASDTTEAAWTANLTPRIGQYASRTVVDEAGSPMTIGLNYGAHNGNTSTAYFAALTDFTRAHRMGVVYWPGLRTGDSYSIESLNADGSLSNNSPSGVAQLRWGWGLDRKNPANDLPAAPPGQPITGTASSKCLDVPGFSTTPGTALDLWDCNGGGNQSWNLESSGELTIYGSLCLTSGAAGTAATIATCAGSDAQHWTANTDGTLSAATTPALCLQAQDTADGSAVVTAACDGSAGQRWTRD